MEQHSLVIQGEEANAPNHRELDRLRRDRKRVQKATKARKERSLSRAEQAFEEEAVIQLNDGKVYRRPEKDLWGCGCEDCRAFDWFDRQGE